MADRDLVSGVVQLANVLTRRLGPVFQRAGVTPQQWSVLSVLGESATPMSLAAISRVMRVSKQNMTGMIARLEQLGLAERAGDPNDLRSARVELTRRGRSLVEKHRASYQEWLSQLGSGAVSERDLQTLARTVDKLIEAIESAGSE
jgi:DNA-binding MarR family transcriptional regulator